MDMKAKGRDAMRRELDERLLAFRVARMGRAGASGGWLRAVRQATGVPAGEVARRMGVSQWEVFRREKAEKTRRIGLDKLASGAQALGCELVYALVPRVGTLEDLAHQQQTVVKLKQNQAKTKRTLWRRTRFKELGGVDMVLKAIRTAMRKEGIRIRPKKRKNWYNAPKIGRPRTIPRELEDVYRQVDQEEREWIKECADEARAARKREHERGRERGTKGPG